MVVAAAADDEQADSVAAYVVASAAPRLEQGKAQMTRLHVRGRVRKGARFPE